MKFKRFFPLTTCAITASLTPFLFVVSCSNGNDVESQMNNIINSDNFINLQVNKEEIKKMTKNDEIFIKDIFTIPANSVIIEYSKELIDWNETHDSIYKIQPEISYVYLPNFSDKSLTKLNVVINISAGPLGIINITKELDLSGINNSLSVPNNFFNEEINNEGITQNKAWMGIYNASLKALQNANIFTNDSEETLIDKINNVVVDEYPNNKLYCYFNSKTSDGVDVIIYTSNKQLDKPTLEFIKNNCVAIKMHFTFLDLEIREVK